MDTASYNRRGIQGYVGLSDEDFDGLCEHLGYDPKAEYYTQAEYFAIMRACGWTSTSSGWTKF